MKKRFFALLLTAVAAFALVMLCACKNGGDDDKKKPEPDPEPVNPFEQIVGNWVVQNIEIMPNGETPEFYTPPQNEYFLKIADDGTFTFFIMSTSQSYEGKAEEGVAAGYYTFSCVTGETTVTAEAYHYAEREELIFNGIRFEGTIPQYNYSTCTCVPSTVLI